MRGITSVRGTSVKPDDYYSLGASIVGRSGFVNQNGDIFCPSQESVGAEYVRAGHFLEGKSLVTPTATLFYVDPKISGC